MPSDYYRVHVYQVFLERGQADRQTNKQTPERPTHAGGYTAGVGTNT